MAFAVGLTLRSTPFASLSGRCAIKPRSAGHLERWATPKPNQKRMRTQQTKLTPHRFAHPEKISQPGAQPETPSPSFATAAACLTTRAYRSAQRGIVPHLARTLCRKACLAKAHSVIASPSANTVVMLMFPLCVVSPTRRSSGTCRKRPAP